MLGGVTRHAHVISPTWGPRPSCKQALKCTLGTEKTSSPGFQKFRFLLMM